MDFSSSLKRSKSDEKKVKSEIELIFIIKLKIS